MSLGRLLDPSTVLALTPKAVSGPQRAPHRPPNFVTFATQTLMGPTPPWATGTQAVMIDIALLVNVKRAINPGRPPKGMLLRRYM